MPIDLIPEEDASPKQKKDKTVDTSKESFEVIDTERPIQPLPIDIKPDIGGTGHGDGPTIPGDSHTTTFVILTEKEHMFYSKIICNAPTYIWRKLPKRDPELIDAFNHELYEYCKKKNINVRDYVFDELGLIMLGLELTGGYFDDYEKYYKKNKEDNKGGSNKDRQHGKDNYGIGLDQDYKNQHKLAYHMDIKKEDKKEE